MSASFAGLAGRLMWRPTKLDVRRGPQVGQGGTQEMSVLVGPETAREPASCLFRAALICEQSLCSRYDTAVSMMVLLLYWELSQL